MESKKTLGQIYTPKIIAQAMIKMIVPFLNKGDVLFDPCVGPNTFFNNLPNNYAFKTSGMEV